MQYATDIAASKNKKIKNKKRCSLEHFKTATKNESPCHIETGMSISIRCGILLDTNAHFASIIRTVYLTIEKSLRENCPGLLSRQFTALVWFEDREFSVKHVCQEHHRNA